MLANTESITSSNVPRIPYTTIPNDIGFFFIYIFDQRLLLFVTYKKCTIQIQIKQNNLLYK